MNSLICLSEQRREAVRQHIRLNGLDYLEVGSDQRTLTVYFLGKAPVSLEPSNVVIEGGRRIRDIKVKEVKVTRTEMAELDDSMEVVTDKEGDFSTYTLRVVIRDEHGDYQPHPSFDPRYDRADFSFKVDCPSDLDCKQDPVCPPEKLEEPEINYLAKDYASFRQLILDRLALVMPEWQERHVPDLGIALVEVLAYAGDHLSYYQDAVATEAYLDTARQRISVRRHARLVDYVLHEGCNARTWVCIETDSVVTLPPRDIYFITEVANLDWVVKDEELGKLPSGGYEIFEPMTAAEIKLYPGQHEIHFYTWGDKECCLPRGAKAATLIGQWIEEPSPNEPPACEPGEKEYGSDTAILAETPANPELHLKPGDVLILEEIIGPKTGNPADADPKRCHAVRITGITPVDDPLFPDLALTEITWAEEDALPFPLCLSVLGPPPECEVIEKISAARGNLILVNHGQHLAEDLDPVLVKETIETCDCAGNVADTVIVPERYRPVLKEAPLTFSEPLTPGISASRMLVQDVRQALPQVMLTGTLPNAASVDWSAQRDLLSSHNPDLHFVVEMDNDRRAHLRFGDDELGQRPDAGTAFRADYRVGNGPSGNVGAGTIAHLVTRMLTLSGGVLSIRNPLAARGGTAPEPMAEAKLFAPHAFRQRLERAITAEDYAAIVLREFGNRVERAAATLRWNGSWYEMLVAVDPLGKEEADPALLEEITGRLHRYRRIGHNLVVKSARRVPLDIELIMCVLPSYLRGHVKAALLEVFSNRRLTDGRLGMFHADNMSFGDGIYLSALVAAAQAVPGVESVNVTKLQRIYEPANGEIENGVLPLGSLEIARLDNDPSFPENGRLRVDMRGGR
ncbi:putative baseplate assembly protein [Devosia sp.]|uniref:putative baseplate assembly protein n=1 Tax=Devosia sp. TaxID=1871048 RepID=UPI0027334185|nr:putative baseplate assembly protein [Devosia sp.]MDP2782650.1 putative baseplate assembly protein [Devosia sp.]MDZ4346932.1 putative baseplate assembly protein [Candidatus Binatia bacterium]